MKEDKKELIIPCEVRKDTVISFNTTKSSTTTTISVTELSKYKQLLKIKDLAKTLIYDIVLLEKPIEDSVVVHLHWYNKLKEAIKELENGEN